MQDKKRPFLQSLQINNLLSFGPDSPAIELGPLNVIIGANGSGKSNLFDVLALLKNAPREFDKPIRESGCPLKEWFWKSTDVRTQSTGIQIIADIQSVVLASHAYIHHRILFRGDNHIEIRETITTSLGPIKSKVVSFDPDTDDKISEISILPSNQSLLSFSQLDLSVYTTKEASLLDKIKSDTAVNEIRSLAQSYKSIHIYNDWTFGRKSPLRFAQLGYLPDKWLNEDGSNLGVVLKKIKNNEESHLRFSGFLKQLYEGVDDYEIDEYKDGTLRVYLREGERVIHASRLSDGTLRYLMLMAVLCDPEPPPVICIEEPEMGLHPDLIMVMGDALRYASERTQVIVTTHSVRLVDCFNDSPKAIQVCEKHDGSTIIERLDPEYLKPWLENYRLGELWTSGEIGGNRW